MGYLKDPGGDRKSEKRDKNYYLARLKRDHPEIFRKLEAGEYSSVRAASIAAGIVKVKVKDNYSKATVIIDKMSLDELSATKDYLDNKFKIEKEKEYKNFDFDFVPVTPDI